MDLQTALDILVAVLLLYFVLDGIREYVTASGSVWRRLWAVAKQSASVLWLRLVGVCAALLDMSEWVAEALNAPQVAQVLQTYGNPRVMAQLIIAITIIAELARRRTLGKSLPAS